MVVKEIVQRTDSSTIEQKLVTEFCEHSNELEGFITTAEFLSS
jgi:hypothetical protein